LTADWLQPEWPAPPGVLALSTTRNGGCSEGAWASMNLGQHCGDAAQHVKRNRERLAECLPAAPQWLRQVHGVTVARHPGMPGAEREADALVAFAPGQVCAVLTADCLPVLFCDRPGSRIAVAHAGWRGLAAGVLQATVNALESDPADLMAWLGPAIGPAVYEVGEEVAAAFPDEFTQAFAPRGDRWLLDLYTVARLKLASVGVNAVFGGGLCTYSDPDRFFSYRHDGITGRMATLVWLEEP
jgi:YfiH family protein